MCVKCILSDNNRNCFKIVEKEMALQNLEYNSKLIQVLTALKDAEYFIIIKEKLCHFPK